MQLHSVIDPPKISAANFNAPARPRAQVNVRNRNVVLSLYVPALFSNVRCDLITAALTPTLGSRDDIMFSVIKAMIEWIEDHLDEPLSVDRVAIRSGYSVWHFQRKFLQFTGLNIYTYIRQRRVMNAAFMLAHTQKRILEIAIENGFNCQASFTRTLREVTLITPGQLRKTYRNNADGLLQLFETLINPA